MRTDRNSRIWAVTCLFNPAGYRARGENYRRFRESLPLPLLTVELAFDDLFTLADTDGDVLIQLREGDVMWQKERLLNLGVRRLPDHVDQVVLIDADMLLPGLPWVSSVSEALQDTPVLQPFRTCHHLDPNGDSYFSNASTISVLDTGLTAEAVIESTIDRERGAPCSGNVWAARRDLLEKHGLYDGCIVGGGDTAWLCAVTGCFGEVIQRHRMGGAQARRYLEWAEKVFEDVGGNVRSLPFEVRHLWHGTMSDRRGLARHEGLSQLGYDPYRDLEDTADAPWRWASDNPELHNYVRNYFRLRQEDNAPQSLVTA